MSISIAECSQLHHNYDNDIIIRKQGDDFVLSVYFFRLTCIENHLMDLFSSFFLISPNFLVSLLLSLYSESLEVILLLNPDRVKVSSTNVYSLVEGSTIFISPFPFLSSPFLFFPIFLFLLSSMQYFNSQ